MPERTYTVTVTHKPWRPGMALKRLGHGLRHGFVQLTLRDSGRTVRLLDLPKALREER